MKYVFVLLAVVIAFGCGGGKTESVEVRVARLKDTFRTPGGLRIRAERGVTVTTEQAAAIERGIQKTLAKVRCKYGRSNEVSSYVVVVLKGYIYNGDPVYRIPCAQYCGTEYDKGGFIYVAGQMVAVGEPYGNVIAIPEQGSRLDNAELIAGFEAEHVELAWFDGDEYERTKTHGQGNGHPIIPGCNQ